MKKKYILYPIIGIVFVICVFALSYLFASLRLDLKDVYISSISLPQRSEIKEEYLKKIKVPGAYINEDVIINKEDIIGKYVKLNAYIPSGSLFYQDSLDKKENMKDAVHLNLGSGEVTYDLFIKDVKTNPANLVEGINVDIYVTISKKDVVSDLLISNAKIIGLYDNNNRRIKNYDVDTSLNVISILINEEMVPYINKAVVLSDIHIIVGSKLYDDNKPQLNYDSKIMEYLK